MKGYLLDTNHLVSRRKRTPDMDRSQYFVSAQGFDTEALLRRAAQLLTLDCRIPLLFVTFKLAGANDRSKA